MINANEKGGGKAIVHCIAGVSRSVSLCAAYLMTHRKSEKLGIFGGRGNMGAEEAVKFIQKRRRCANPNPGFMRQLINFEKEFAKQSMPDDLHDTSKEIPKGDEAIREAIEAIEKMKGDMKSVDLYC